MEIHHIKEMTTAVVKLYTINHDHLEIRDQVVGNQLFITIHPEASDYAKLIGRRGANFKAINNVIGEIGKRIGIQVKVAVGDAQPYVGNKMFDGPTDRFHDDLKAVVQWIFAGVTNPARTVKLELVQVEGLNEYVLQVNIDEDERRLLSEQFEQSLAHLVALMSAKHGKHTNLSLVTIY